jgi:hypothetical protein
VSNRTMLSEFFILIVCPKVSMPNNAQITACSWNREQGYIAAGSVEGLVKVIKLEITDSK